MALSVTADGAELVVYWCCSGRITEKERMQQQEVREEVRSREERTWRLEPEGEAEVPEIIIVSDAVKGTKVDLDGKGLQVEADGEDSKKVETAKRKDRTERRKEEKRLKCTLLNGSVWSTEKKSLRRYKGKCDVFFGIRGRRKWRDSSTKWPRKDGGLQRVQRDY